LPEIREMAAFAVNTAEIGAEAAANGDEAATPSFAVPAGLLRPALCSRLAAFFGRTADVGT
jgi:hypothetical protein